MVYGIVELINFAHGDLFMLGCFYALAVVGGLSGDPSWKACLWLTVPVGYALFRGSVGASESWAEFFGRSLKRCRSPPAGGRRWGFCTSSSGSSAAARRPRSPCCS